MSLSYSSSYSRGRGRRIAVGDQTEKISLRPYLKSKLKKQKSWECGSGGRVLGKKRKKYHLNKPCRKPPSLLSAVLLLS
jgi:hypothetical protein